MNASPQTESYWIRWAELRGAHYYETRTAWESAESCAPCVSSDPKLQAAFIEGWKRAEAAA